MTPGASAAVSDAPALSVRRLRKTFGSVVAVDDVTLDVASGEFLSLLGPSGCGKSTLLRAVAGLVEPDGGQVILAGEDITRVAVHRRNLGLVFQSYALFPHMTVFENVAFGLRRRGVGPAELRPRVERMLELVRLGPLGARHPRELSGGQQQRVALARALVLEPRVLLDEPLSNLDALLRDEMRVELKRLQERLRTTMIFVTHDQAEALILSDRVVVMEAGRVEQIGRPEEVYRRPATAFVARFLGRANFLAGTVAETGPTGTVVALDGGGLSVVGGPRPGLVCGQPVRVAIRQESVRLERPGSDVEGPNHFAATIVFHAFAGQAHHYVVQLADGRELEIAAPGATPPLARGSRTHVAWSPDEVIVLPGDTAWPARTP